MKASTVVLLISIPIIFLLITMSFTVEERWFTDGMSLLNPIIMLSIPFIIGQITRDFFEINKNKQRKK
jgi:ACR3 family arsenite efflux pump ArsB